MANLDGSTAGPLKALAEEAQTALKGLEARMMGPPA